MNAILLCMLFFFLTIISNTNSQWYIIKKDYPSNLMNYPNPGKRNLPDEKSSIDCSIPYSYLQTYQEKTIWLLLCRDQASPLTAIDDDSIPSSLNLNDQRYSSPRLISHERRTPRSPPPYFSEQKDLFEHRLLGRLRRAARIKQL